MSASPEDVRKVAEVAAIIECNDYKNVFDDVPNGADLGKIDKSLEGFKLLDKGTFLRDEYRADYPESYECLKAIVVQDREGNIYVHFNGTGDGNWQYNSVAYGPQNGSTTSPVQDWAVDFFDSVYEEQCNTDEFKNSKGKIYVTGHSQGGNNAQSVTIRSQYGDKIDNCVSLCGPGFSEQAVEEDKARYGEEQFNLRRDKIYAVNGENDYVSPLGQEQIVPEGHTQYVNYDDENNGADFVKYHAATGLVNQDDDGTIHLNGFTENSEYSDFRKMVVALNEKVKQLPPEKQAELGMIVMKIVENKNGADEVITAGLTQDDIDRLVETFIPVLVEFLAEHPDMVEDVLNELGIDPEYSALADSVLHELNKLDLDTRQEALEELAKAIVVDDEGGIAFDWSKLSICDWLDLGDTTLHAIIATVVKHPGDIQQVLKKLGVDTYIRENPAAAVATVIAVAGSFPILVDIAEIVVIIDAVYHFVEDIVDLANGVKEFILQSLTAIENAINRILDWANRNFNKGAKYSRENPYIKVDTGALRIYAQRVSNVNKRLRILDGDLRTLYLQVGFADLWKILGSNLLTNKSYALTQVANYLNDTASNMDSADNTARGYVGG